MTRMKHFDRKFNQYSIFCIFSYRHVLRYVSVFYTNSQLNSGVNLAARRTLSSNVIIRFFGRLLILGKQFMHDCNIIGLDPKSVAHISFSAVRCAISEHFAASTN